jgi:hypothetical protein
VPIVFFTLISSTLATIFGLFYFWNNRILFFGNLVILLLPVFICSARVFYKLDVYSGDTLLWTGRTYAAIMLVFYTLFVFKKWWNL